MAKRAGIGSTSGKQPKTRTPTKKTGKEPEKNAESAMDTVSIARRQKSEIRRLQKIYKDLPSILKLIHTTTKFTLQFLSEGEWKKLSNRQ